MRVSYQVRKVHPRALNSVVLLFRIPAEYIVHGEGFVFLQNLHHPKSVSWSPQKFGFSFEVEMFFKQFLQTPLVHVKSLAALVENHRSSSSAAFVTSPQLERRLPEGDQRHSLDVGTIDLGGRREADRLAVLDVAYIFFFFGGGAGFWGGMGRR